MPATRRALIAALTMPLVGAIAPDCADAATAHEIDAGADRALRTLYAAEPRTRELARRAKGILIFPNILRAGLILGGQGGDGVLRVNGRNAGYYNISGGSVGLQAGAETFSYAMFFMNDAALRYLRDSNGWEIGSGPTIAVMDKGAAASLTSTTLTKDVYAFPFGVRGLMAGINLEGSKITQIKR